MATHSYWLDYDLPPFPALNAPLRVDVLVIGGGITGITAAYLLKKAGRRVALIERGRLATRDTGHTTAHLTYVTDARLRELVKTFGRDHAHAAWDAGVAAMEQIEANVRDEQIECELREVPGYLHVPPEGEAKRELESLQEDAELAASMGFDATVVSEVPLVKQPGVRFANQSKFHVRKYLAGLARQIPGDGSHVFEESESTTFHDDPLAVEVNGQHVTCDAVVMATHPPLQGLNSFANASLLQTKLALYTTYAVSGKLGAGTLPEALFWDTNDPYGYLRVERFETHDYAIYGGEDHKTGQVADTEEVFARLEKAFRRICPAVALDRRWSGQVVETNDGLPFIGEEVPRQFVATGFSGNGMTFGTLGGVMARDWVLGIKNPWTELFAINRRTFSSAWDYLTENKDYPFYLLKGQLGKADASSLDAVAAGEGKVVRLHGKKIAAYRDASGEMHTCSAVCTHMGCVVRWNPAEQTWDCPCHGSRFEPTGEVRGGPAETPLEKVEH